MADLRSFKQDIQSLVRKFEQDKNHYLQKDYPEAQVRIDFLNPFFDSLGWEIENKAYKPHHERDVFVELSPETSLCPDYNFRINGNTKFFVEAKAPWVPLDDVNDIMQAKTYACSNCICKKPIFLRLSNAIRSNAKSAMDEKIDEIVDGLYGLTNEEQK